MKYSTIVFKTLSFTCGMVLMASSAWSQAVTGLTLINAETNQAIAGYAPISNNATINLAVLPTRQLNIRADVSGVVGSIVFSQDNVVQSTESTAPFAMFGDVSGAYLPWTPAIGLMTISATPFQLAGGQGTAGAINSINVNFTDTGTGSVTINPSTSQPLRQNGRFFVRGNSPVFIVGAGGPEGFLYESNVRKTAIVDQLIALGINGIYFHSIRAYGGDGGIYEHPFTAGSESASNKVIDATKLQAWAAQLDRLDQAGIVMWFALFDDHASPFGCFNDTNKSQYESYTNTIVNAFKGYKNIIWVTQEEWNWRDTGCSGKSNRNQQIAVAAAIRAADTVHPIAVHHMNGQTFQFAAQATIGVYGQQSGGGGIAGATTVSTMRSQAAKAGFESAAAYVMAEAHSYHKDLIKAANDTDVNVATAATTEMRQSLWALAMGGAAGIYVYDMYECHAPGNYSQGAKLCSGPDAGETEAKPTANIASDMKRLKEFMQSTKFHQMTPLFETPLASVIAGGTQWIVQNPAQGLYMLYASNNPSNLGVKSVAAGTYAYKWFNPVNGNSNSGSFTHAGGDLLLNKPAVIGLEAVVYIYPI